VREIARCLQGKEENGKGVMGKVFLVTLVTLTEVETTILILMRSWRRCKKVRSFRRFRMIHPAVVAIGLMIGIWALFGGITLRALRNAKP